MVVRVEHISAVTLAVRDMARSVDFYRQLGLPLAYGGTDASFSSFRAGQGFINVIVAPLQKPNWWGRVILRVTDVDAIHQDLRTNGLSPEPVRDGEWGERYFHLRDPDGHELSFAQTITREHHE